MNCSLKTRILLVGQIIVDVTIPEVSEEPKLRLGGIIHSARALWAIGCLYGLAYIAPDYLDNQIQQYAESIQADPIRKIGSVIGSPNILLIREPKEHGPKGYEYLLRDELTVSLNSDNLSGTVNREEWTDVLIFPGGFDLEPTLRTIGQHNARVYIDVNFEPEDWTVLNHLGRGIDTIIISTSSKYFTKHAKMNVNQLLYNAHEIRAEHLLLKENRGGSRFFKLRNHESLIRTPAHVRPITHSVGVGDCFNAILVALRHSYPDQQALAYASCISAEYASTTCPDTFKNNSLAWLKVPGAEIVEMEGISLCWEERPDFQIYIAAPDFDFVDTRPIDRLVESLKYHNFRPRLPVREHGQVGGDATLALKWKIYQADLALLEKCSILIAVLLFNDPGTLVEIGIALEKGIPILVYDPYDRAKNLMLTESAKIISADLEEIIMGVFEEAQKRSKK